MRKRFSAGLALAAACLPALVAAQQPAPQSTPKPPSPFLALDLREELRLSAEQLARITVARDSLREAHRVHCGPMHASTPTEAEEAKHHEEMAVINARWEGQARSVLTPEQTRRLAELHAARPAAPAAGHGSHSGHPAPKKEEHGGHHDHPSR